jgi:SAM-dependent methyltransferase
MREYFGQSATKYQQTKSKKYVLFPGIMRNLPRSANSKTKLLDVGCGKGDLHPLVKEKGYQYCGLDISPDMIKIGRMNYPDANFVVADARKYAKLYAGKFDVVLMNMLLTTFKTKKEIVAALIEAKKILSSDGIIIIGTIHPCFDHYMQKRLFNRIDVETEFKGYYKSGQKFIINQDLGRGLFTFVDYHWTFNDYISSFNKAGLIIKNIDECPPKIPNSLKDNQFLHERKNYPTYLVFLLSF